MRAPQPEGLLLAASRLRPVSDPGVMAKQLHLVVQVAAGGPCSHLG